MLTRFFTQKSTLYGANLGLIVVMVFGILFFLNILAVNFNWRKDITRSQLNSLSPQSIKVLKDLKQDVKVYYFNSAQEKEKMEPIFRNFSYQTKRFQYQFVDTGKQPTLTLSMDVKKNDTLVFSLVDSAKKVKVEGATEEKITNGLIKLLRSKDQIVYFTTGHNEKSLESAQPDGISRVKEELEKQGFTVKELNLMTAGKVPEDASVLAIFSPQSEFFPKELEILSAWIKANGKAFISFDLDIGANGLSKGGKQLAQMVKAYGLEVHDKMLVDPNSKAANVEPQVLLGFSASKDHPITKDFPTSAIGIVANFFFPLTTYLSAIPAEGYDLSMLSKTSPQAWAVSDWVALKKGLVAYQKGKDVMGELGLAYAVESKRADEKAPVGTRLTVFANSRFAYNDVIDKALNRDLFLNSISWLSNDEQLISIRAKDQDTDKLNVNNNILNLVFIVVVLFCPIFAIVFGVMVWWRRSKQ